MHLDSGGEQPAREVPTLPACRKARRNDGRLDRGSGLQSLERQMDSLRHEDPFGLPQRWVAPQGAKAAGDGVGPGQHGSIILNAAPPNSNGAIVRIITPSSKLDGWSSRCGGSFDLHVPGRKVRTPKGSVLGNAQAWKRDG